MRAAVVSAGAQSLEAGAVVSKDHRVSPRGRQRGRGEMGREGWKEILGQRFIWVNGSSVPMPRNTLKDMLTRNAFQALAIQ